MAKSQVSRRQANAWSESQPRAPHGAQTANQAMAQVHPATEAAPNLAVALHDPVGALSEVNHLLGGHLKQFADFSEEASRKLFASHAIDTLIQQDQAAARQKES